MERDLTFSAGRTITCPNCRHSVSLRVGIESTPGRTVLEVDVPSQPQPNVPPVAVPALPLHAARVVVAVEGAGTREFIKDLLEASQFEVIEAVSSEELFSVVGNYLPATIVADFGMQDVIRTIAMRSRAALVMVSSGYGKNSAYSAPHAYLLGADDYVERRSLQIDLVDKIKLHLNLRQGLGEALQQGGLPRVAEWSQPDGVVARAPMAVEEVKPDVAVESPCAVSSEVGPVCEEAAVVEAAVPPSLWVEEEKEEEQEIQSIEEALSPVVEPVADVDASLPETESLELPAWERGLGEAPTGEVAIEDVAAPTMVSEEPEVEMEGALPSPEINEIEPVTETSGYPWEGATVADQTGFVTETPVAEEAPPPVIEPVAEEESLAAPVSQQGWGEVPVEEAAVEESSVPTFVAEEQEVAVEEPLPTGEATIAADVDQTLLEAESLAPSVWERGWGEVPVEEVAIEEPSAPTFVTEAQEVAVGEPFPTEEATIASDVDQTLPEAELLEPPVWERGWGEAPVEEVPIEEPSASAFVTEAQEVAVEEPLPTEEALPSSEGFNQRVPASVEGGAPRALLVEGATRAPEIEPPALERGWGEGPVEEVAVEEPSTPTFWTEEQEVAVVPMEEVLPPPVMESVAEGESREPSAWERGWNGAPVEEAAVEAVSAPTRVPEEPEVEVEEPLPMEGGKPELSFDAQQNQSVLRSGEAPSPEDFNQRAPASVEGEAPWALPSPEIDEPILPPVVINPKEMEAAKRLARIIVSDIVLYNEKKVLDGIRNGTFYALLKDDIDEGRKHYNSRTSSDIQQQSDYLTDAFEAFIEKKRVHLS